MKVRLINKDEVKDFYKKWGLFSCKCYDTNPKFAERVGKSCHQSGHYSGSRSFYFIFDIDDVPRSTIEQMARHEQGVVKNIKSQRYTDSSRLGYYIPDVINKYNDLLEAWTNGFESDRADYQYIVNKLEEYEGYTGEKAREVARGRIGIDIHSSATVGFTIEALEHFMHKRICFRSQEGIRKLANLIKQEVLEVLPELKEYLVPTCAYLGYCTEGKHQCSQLKNVYPTKEEFKEIINSSEYRRLVKGIKSRS